MNGSRIQRSKRVNHRAVANSWTANGIEHMVKHARECGRTNARGSRNWFHALQYLSFVALKVGHGRVHLSNEQIARHTGIDVRTVQRITALAQASGVLILEERGGRRRRGGRTICRANSWRLNPACHRPPATKAGRAARSPDENTPSPAGLMGDIFVRTDPPRGPETPVGGAESAPPAATEPLLEDQSSAEEVLEAYWARRKPWRGKL